MLTLTKDMEIGVAKVDNQHRELIDRINAVIKLGMHAVSLEETKKTISLLDEYVVKHFHDEEVLQVESKYPKYESHKEKHQNFLKDLEKRKKEFATGGYSAHFTMELSKIIINWIVTHIKTEDIEFGAHYRQWSAAK